MSVFENLATKFPALVETKIVQPRSYWWPNFLKATNLINIANQIAVIAILAVGMTLVIITGGIDLSVGSLIALSAVVAARLIRDLAGGEQAGTGGMVACCVVGVAQFMRAKSKRGACIGARKMTPNVEAK